MDARRLIPVLMSALGLAVLPAAAGAQVQEVAPDVKDLKIKPAKFKPTGTGAVVVEKGGALVTFTLSGGAPVRFSLKRETNGKRQGGRCAAGKPKSKKQTCTRTSNIPGFFRLPGIAGPNELRISGWWGETLAKLKPGRYRLVAKAEGLAARSSYARFTITS